MPKTVLALDVSVVATGFAFGPVGGTPVSGVVRFAPKGASDDEVWLAALKWTTDRMNVFAPDVVAIEAPFMRVPTGEDGEAVGSVETIFKLWGLQSVIRTVVKAKLPGVAKLVHASSARKVLTGKGNYPKGQAKPAVKRSCVALGWVDADGTYDRCDALCVWAKACADLDPSVASQFTPLFAEAV